MLRITKVILGELTIARIAESTTQAYAKIVNVASGPGEPHVIEKNYYASEMDAMRAVEMLVPEPCRACIRFIDGGTL